MNDKKWYAVYTKTRCEKKVALLLSKKNIENYCPLNKVTKQWADRKKMILEPLFTCYVFVRISPAEHTHMLNTDGIIRIIYWLGKPAIIRDVEIEMIKKFLSQHSNVAIEKTQVALNDKVRIISGPLMEQEGKIIAVKSKSVKIVLPSLGYMMSAEVDLDKIELINDQLRIFVGKHDEPQMM